MRHAADARLRDRNLARFLLARAISCGEVAMPSAGLTAMNIGWSAMKPIGRKSRGSWTGRLGATVGSATKGRQRRRIERVAVGHRFRRGARPDAAVAPGRRRQ